MARTKWKLARILLELDASSQEARVFEREACLYVKEKLGKDLDPTNPKEAEVVLDGLVWYWSR